MENEPYAGNHASPVADEPDVVAKSDNGRCAVRDYKRPLAAILTAFIIFAARIPILHMVSPHRSLPVLPDVIIAETVSARLAGARLGKPEDPPQVEVGVEVPPAKSVPAKSEPTPSSTPRPAEPASRSGRKLTVTATAYTSNEGGSLTYTGAHVTPWHTLAVDPKQILLGSWVYIPYFADKPNKGWFYAEDVGSAIKTNRIDIYFEDLDDALEFGMRDLEILVSDTPPNLSSSR